MGCKKSYDYIISIIISLIVAIIIGVIFDIAVVTGLFSLLYIIIGLAAFFLISLIAIALFGKRREDYCVCKYGKCLVIGSLGAIIASALMLSLTLTATASAIFIGIITFFILLTIIQFFLLMIYIIKANCMYKE